MYIIHKYLIFFLLFLSTSFYIYDRRSQIIRNKSYFSGKYLANTANLSVVNILCYNSFYHVIVHSLSPRGVFTLFLRDKPETDMREIAVLRFLCIGCCERSEQ